MSERIDIFYLNGEGLEMHNENISFEELFLRKLVDATMVRNCLWEHEHHENLEFKQAAVHVQAWTVESLDEYGRAVEQALFQKYDVSKYYEIQWWVWRHSSFQMWRTEPVEHALRAASLMLDHAHVLDSLEYHVCYAVLDLDRRKLHVFLIQN